MSVLIYTTPSCPYCQLLKKFLRDNKVDFSEIDISRDAEKAREAVQKSGQYVVPIIDINGKIIVGFDRSLLAKELNIK